MNYAEYSSEILTMEGFRTYTTLKDRKTTEDNIQDGYSMKIEVEFL